MNQFEPREKTIQLILATAGVNELDLIAKILGRPELIPTVATLISSNDFIVHPRAFQTIVNASMESKSVVTEFMANDLKFSDFLGHDSFRDIRDIISDIRQTGAAHNLVGILEKAVGSVPTSGIQAFMSQVQIEMLDGVQIEDKESSHIDAVIKDYKEKREYYIEKFKAGDGIIGIPCGFSRLDEVVDGLRPEHLWVIGGYSSMGKTQASLNIVANLVRQKRRAVYFSLEMSKVDILSRVVGILSNQNGLRILKGYEKDEGKVTDLFKQVQDSHFAMHSTKYTLADIEFAMIEENVKEKVDLFVVDFLQLMIVKGARSEYETVTQAITGLQQMAKRLKTTIMVLSQLSNEGAKNADEVVMSFKGSGGIAAAADFAIELQIGEENKALWKQKMQSGEHVFMKWNIRKNRHGRTGYVDMEFDGSSGIFRQVGDPVTIVNQVKQGNLLVQKPYNKHDFGAFN